MIGLSLSFCVGDLCLGRVNYAEIEKIIAGTCFSNEEEMEAVIGRYLEQGYWSNHKEEAAAYIRKLYSEGKIEQPKLNNPNVQGNDLTNGWWIPAIPEWEVWLEGDHEPFIVQATTIDLALAQWHELCKWFCKNHASRRVMRINLDTSDPLHK